MRESKKSTNIEWNGNNLWDLFGLVYYSQKNICICVGVLLFVWNYFERAARQDKDRPLNQSHVNTRFNGTKNRTIFYYKYIPHE